MTTPSRDDFKALAREHTVVPLWREALADLATPVSGFLRTVGTEPGFLLESVEHERWGRWSFLGRRPAATFVARGRNVVVEGGTVDASIPLDRGILPAVERVLEL
ncbi:MAG: anthranilate synthase component I, partial [Acidimicrobiales bacterium]